MRVGRIVSIEPHPGATELFVEKIDLGEPTGPRTVVSGLRKFYQEAQLAGRMVLTIHTSPHAIHSPTHFQQLIKPHIRAPPRCSWRRSIPAHSGFEPAQVLSGLH